MLTEPPDDTIVQDLRWRRYALPVTALAQELQVFSHLQHGPLTVAQIAERMCASSRAAEVVVSVVCALRLTTRDAAGVVRLTEIGASHLVEESPFACGRLLPPDDPLVAMVRAALHTPALPLAVAMRELPPSRVRGFIDGMHRLSFPAGQRLAVHPAFDSVSRLVDVGGGAGSLSIALAMRHPTIHCTILELDEVLPFTVERIAFFALAGRVTVVAQDMFGPDEWPSDNDAVLFGNVFHDWDLDQCATLARRSFEALRPGGSILLHEMPLDDAKDGPLTVACLSVAMLLFERGRQYTSRELADVLAAAGFVNFRRTNTYGYYALLRAEKPLR